MLHLLVGRASLPSRDIRAIFLYICDPYCTYHNVMRVLIYVHTEIGPKFDCPTRQKMHYIHLIYFYTITQGIFTYSLIKAELSLTCLHVVYALLV